MTGFLCASRHESHGSENGITVFQSFSSFIELNQCMKRPSLRFFWFSFSPAAHKFNLPQSMHKSMQQNCNKYTHAHKLALDMCMTFGRQETFDKTHRNFIVKFLKLLNDGIYCRWKKEKGRGKCSVGDAVKLQIVLFKQQSKISDNDKQTIHLASVYMPCVCVCVLKGNAANC